MDVLFGISARLALFLVPYSLFHGIFKWHCSLACEDAPEQRYFSSFFSSTSSSSSPFHLQLVKAYEELNKRIYEHDKCVASGSSQVEVTLQVSGQLLSVHCGIWLSFFLTPLPLINIIFPEFLHATHLNGWLQ